MFPKLYKACYTRLIYLYLLYMYRFVSVDIYTCSYVYLWTCLWTWASVCMHVLRDFSSFFDFLFICLFLFSEATYLLFSDRISQWTRIHWLAYISWMSKPSVLWESACPAMWNTFKFRLHARFTFLCLRWESVTHS